MELIQILRELWRCRRLVIVAGLIAITVGVLIAYRPSSSGLQRRSYSLGIGVTRVLIDTPDSQVVDLAPKGADGLGSRADLLANLLASGPLRLRIARLAHVPPDKLLAMAPSTAGPIDPSLLAQSGTAAASAPSTFMLTMKPDPELPIVFINTQAPDAATASRLANSATVALRDYLHSVAAAQKVPNARQVVVTQLGTAQSAKVTRGPSRAIALLVAVVIFGVLCGLIVALVGLVRGWAAAAAAEHNALFGAEPIPDFDDAVEFAPPASAGLGRAPYPDDLSRGGGQASTA